MSGFRIKPDPADPSDQSDPDTSDIYTPPIEVAGLQAVVDRIIVSRVGRWMNIRMVDFHHKVFWAFSFLPSHVAPRLWRWRLKACKNTAQANGLGMAEALAPIGQ